MIRFQRLSLIAAGCALALVPMIVAAQSEAAKGKIAGKTALAASELKWGPMPGLAGAEQAALFGDSTKEAHRIMYRWAPGTKAPLHTHTHGDRGVIISGTLSLAIDGAAPKMLPAGSYFSLAGGVKHVTAVEGNAPCVFFVEREGPFDAHMIEGSGAPK